MKLTKKNRCEKIQYYHKKLDWVQTTIDAVLLDPGVEEKEKKERKH